MDAIDWQDDALCPEVDPEIFFPEPGEKAPLAKFICGRCPVIDACRSYALKTRQQHGVWGGWSVRQRMVFLRKH